MHLGADTRRQAWATDQEGPAAALDDEQGELVACRLDRTTRQPRLASPVEVTVVDDISRSITAAQRASESYSALSLAAGGLLSAIRRLDHGGLATPARSIGQRPS